MHSLIEQFSPSGAFAGPAGRALLACLVSFALTMIFAPRVIRELISLKIGQPIRTAEEVHKLAELHGAKAGTPTMGGVLIVGSMTAATLLCARMGNPFIISCLIVTLALGLLGFRDDYLKVAKKTSDGISARKKLLVQFLAGLAGVTFLYLYPEGSPRVELHDYISSLFIPFYGQVNLPWFVYIPFGVVVVMSASNAVNLTDGLDGLAAGSSAIIGVALGILAYMSSHFEFASFLNIMFIPGAEELVVFAAAFIGATVGFLWYNAYPAQVFMGDTGSLTLGGIIAVFAIIIRKELLIPILCGIFLVENLSVLMQTFYFKYTKKKYGEGRRIFKMAPLHHHFQKLGNAGIQALIQKPFNVVPESKIVVRFWLIGIILAVITIVTLKMR